MENKTMTTIEHLQRIKAKCEQLRTIAEKRTHGRWKEDSATEVWSEFSDWIADCMESEYDAAFIASCAGPAEAGWRSTIAAIDDILTVDQDLTPEVQKITTEMILYLNRNLVQSLLSAWPEEILN